MFKLLLYTYRSDFGIVLSLSVYCGLKITNTHSTSWYDTQNEIMLFARILFQFHRVIALIELKTPIDFGVSRSNVKVTMTRRVKSVSAQ